MNILNQLEKHNIHPNLQHGFRSGRSCEMQLPVITTIHDLLSFFIFKSKTDVAILDFSHAGLLGKLEHYGIVSKILLWICESYTVGPILASQNLCK